MGYRACKEQTNKKGKCYYAYILCYVDDLLVIHHHPKKVLDRINEYLPLKGDSVGPPEFYLGAKLKKKEFDDKTTAWGLSPAKYVQAAVKNCEAYLKDKLNGTIAFRRRQRTLFRMITIRMRT